jgi:CRP-like cAMP-binding protein
MDKDLLRNIPLFAKLSEGCREALAGQMQSRTVSANQPIFWIGENGEDMFIVQHGQIRLSYPDEGGAEVTIAVVGPGAFFGELSLLDGGPRTATAWATTDATVLALDRQGFYQFLDHNPEAAAHMVAVLGHRLRQSMSKLRGIRNINEEVDQQITHLQRIVDKAAAIGASSWFLVANILFIITWMVAQALRFEGTVDFHDTPPTFFWLGFMITLEAILLTMFVLNSQKRQAERDRIRGDLEYQVNLKAQVEVMQLHQKMDRLLKIVEKGPEEEKREDGQDDL